MELLLEKGADFDGRNDNVKAALCRAAKRGRHKMVELLLENGADVDARYAEATALQGAAKLGSISTVQLLIDAGADLEAKVNYKGLQSTASDIAKEEGRMDVFELLQTARKQRKTLLTQDLTQSQNLVDESNSPADQL